MSQFYWFSKNFNFNFKFKFKFVRATPSCDFADAAVQCLREVTNLWVGGYKSHTRAVTVTGHGAATSCAAQAPLFEPRTYLHECPHVTWRTLRASGQVLMASRHCMPCASAPGDRRKLLAQTDLARKGTSRYPAKTQPQRFVTRLHGTPLKRCHGNAATSRDAQWYW